MVRLAVCLLVLASCSTVSPYRSVGDPTIDEPFAQAFEALEPLEKMEEATCALHDLADQASALRGVIKIDGQKFKINSSKLDELPPGLRGGLKKLNEGMSKVSAMQNRLKKAVADLDAVRHHSRLRLWLLKCPLRITAQFESAFSSKYL